MRGGGYEREPQRPALPTCVQRSRKKNPQVWPLRRKRLEKLSSWRRNSFEV